MKDIVKSIKDNATSRLKNPIVGAFVLAWTFLNINGVLLFIMVDKSEKIKMIKNKAWHINDDLMFPLLIAILYLFILPILNMAYEAINDGVINFRRSSRQYLTAKKLAIQKKSTVLAEIEADTTYLQKLKDKEIESWLEEKSKRNNEFIALKALYAKVISESSESKRKSLAELSKLNQQLYSLQNERNRLSKEQHENNTFIEDKMVIIERLINNIENNELAGEFTVEITELRNVLSSIRINFMIWDEDVPF